MLVDSAALEPDNAPDYSESPHPNPNPNPSPNPAQKTDGRAPAASLADDGAAKAVAGAAADAEAEAGAVAGVETEAGVEAEAAVAAGREPLLQYSVSLHVVIAERFEHPVFPTREVGSHRRASQLGRLGARIPLAVTSHPSGGSAPRAVR